MTDVETRLAKAKTSLILEHPFVGSIALNMPFELTDQVPTAATNGKQIIFNPEFVNKLSDEELKFLVAHECFHPMLEHNFRRGERDPKKWNQAADYVINQLLTDEGIGRMPDCGLLDRSIYDAGNGTSEGIFGILPENQDGDGDGGGDSGYNGTELDECMDAEGSPAEKEQQASEWRVKTAQAAQAAKMMGKMSGNMQRVVDEVLSPKVNWRDVLQRFVVKVKDDTRSFARPNRRFLSQGLYMPSADGERLGDIAVAIDCSGSVSPDDLNQFAAELRVIKEDHNPRMLHVLYFDHDVSHYECYGPDDELDIKPHGGGGTAFAPIFKYLYEQMIQPAACVVLTDLCSSEFGSAPDYPVLWVSDYGDDAPFGEVVKV